ncbi:MAG: S41 family peptidase [Planctomycetota bacterium]
MKIYLISLLLLCCGLLLGAGDFDIPKELPKELWPAEVPASELTLAESNIIKAACELIYTGQFDAADGLLQFVKLQDNASLASLKKIIGEYKAIRQQRQTAQEEAYKEQLAELEKSQIAAKAGDVNDVNDVNDSNEISKLLSVIAKAGEFAAGEQKATLLSNPFVKLTFQRAIDKAAEFESKGKWLDAYIVCYSWLQVIDEDNKTYSDYAERLIEKANILASFRDSPCETSAERYDGVDKKMFERSIEALNLGYVSIIDYTEMARKAVRRCVLLADVISKATETAGNLPAGISKGTDSNSISRIRDISLNLKQLEAWNIRLGTILYEINQSLTGISKDKFLDIFRQVLAFNRTTIELPEEILITQFSEAALSALDPYTAMVWPQSIEEFDKAMTNEFTGIGIEITKKKGFLTVGSLLLDTPAYNSGLDAGDVIEKVDGISTKDMSLTCAVRRITGPSGTKVTLSVRSPGDENTRDITITRARIIVSTIRGWQRTETGKWLYMIDEANKIGYVRITGFSGETGDNFEKVLLTQLEAEGLRGLVLDLRFNTGGLLNSAVKITDKFIEKGLIVSTHPRWHQPRTYAFARQPKTHPDYPLVILINSVSASASEIVAGALADPQHNRAVLVGDRTHGKGSVQTITGYPGGGAQLKYTMAYYHLPSGQRVENREVMKKRGSREWGVAPNIELKLRNDELIKLADIRRNNDVLVKIGHNSGEPLKKHTAEELLAVDPQLAVGVLVLKAKQIEKTHNALNAKLQVKN